MAQRIPTRCEPRGVADHVTQALSCWIVLDRAGITVSEVKIMISEMEIMIAEVKIMISDEENKISAVNIMIPEIKS